MDLFCVPCLRESSSWLSKDEQFLGFKHCCFIARGNVSISIASSVLGDTKKVVYYRCLDSDEKIFFAHFLNCFSHFWNVLPSQGPDCPDHSSFCQFQVQALMPAHHTVTVPMSAVKVLYTSTFHWGLKVTSHCCVVVHLCFIWDQQGTTAVAWSQFPCTLSSFCTLNSPTSGWQATGLQLKLKSLCPWASLLDMSAQPLAWQAIWAQTPVWQGGGLADVKFCSCPGTN